MDEEYWGRQQRFCWECKIYPGDIVAEGRQSIGTEGGYQLREPSVLHGKHFGAKKDNIGPENTYFRNDYPEILDR